MPSQAVTEIEADTKYLFIMKGGLAAAVAAGNKESASEYREALLMLMSVTESQVIKAAAGRAIAIVAPIVGAGTVQLFTPKAVLCE